MTKRKIQGKLEERKYTIMMDLLALPYEDWIVKFTHKRTNPWLAIPRKKILCLLYCQVQERIH